MNLISNNYLPSWLDLIIKSIYYKTKKFGGNMAESSKEMKFIEGVDLDEKNVSIEYDNTIEYEINDYVSLMYSKNEKKFYIEFIDYEDTYDEIRYELDDDFDGMTFNGVFVSKEDYCDFKELILKSA